MRAIAEPVRAALRKRSRGPSSSWVTCRRLPSPELRRLLRAGPSSVQAVLGERGLHRQVVRGRLPRRADLGRAVLRRRAAVLVGRILQLGLLARLLAGRELVRRAVLALHPEHARELERVRIAVVRVAEAVVLVAAQADLVAPELR